MSSLGAWAAIRSPGGIWNLAPPPPLVNHFNDYNQVLVHYCSSDSWIGSARLQGIAATNGTAYDIQFQGEAIVNAVIETLLAGPTMPDAGPVQDKFQYELPDLDDATEILFGAESAGANGLRHHLDRLHDWLEPLTGATVRGLLDASFTPAEWDPGIDWSDPFSPGDYADLLARDIEVTVRSFWGADDSALDASCLDPAWEADHLAVGGLHPQICFDTAYVQLNHITTPVFQRMDIDDPLGEQRYFAWHLFPTLPDDYWLAVHDQLGDFTAGTGLEPPGTVPGIQGPNCGKHVAVQTTPGFFRDRASGPTYPTPLPFHDLLVNWLNGVPPGDDTIQIQEDALGAGLYSPSQCF